MVKKTILVVDDDMLMMKMMRFTLSAKGFEVLEASNGQEALDVLAGHKQNVDLILTDYDMPFVNGLQLANAVRVHQKYQDIPLILITSNNEITSKPDERYSTFNCIIPKPFSSELILGRVADLIGV